MKACLLLAGVAVAGASCFSFAASGEGQAPPAAPARLQGRSPQPEPQLIELSGRLLRPVKWTPQLEIMPAGQIKRFDLRGNLLEGIAEGTPLRVRGVVRSQLHRGDTPENRSPIPSQWIIWLEVTKVEVLDHPLDVLQENAGR